MYIDIHMHADVCHGESHIKIHVSCRKLVNFNRHRKLKIYKKEEREKNLNKSIIKNNNNNINKHFKSNERSQKPSYHALSSLMYFPFLWAHECFAVQ